MKKMISIIVVVLVLWAVPAIAETDWEVEALKAKQDAIVLKLTLLQRQMQELQAEWKKYQERLVELGAVKEKPKKKELTNEGKKN